MDSKQPKGSIFLSTLSAAFFFLYGCFLIINPAMALDVTVCASGCDYTSIGPAITAVSAAGGGTVTVTDSRGYSECITMKDGVNVVSSDGQTPTINCTSGGTSTVTFNGPISCNLDGFNITHTQRKGAGIFLDNTGDTELVTISNCSIHDIDLSAGIRMDGDVVCTITGNTIYDCCEAGIATAVTPSGGVADQLTSGSDVTIKGNTIGDSTNPNGEAGIYLDGSGSNITVTIGDSGAGGNNTIYGNAITGIWLKELTNATIENNYVHNHWLAGIGLTDVDNATILNNEISYNQAGIQFDLTCVNATVESNQIHHNNRAGIRNGPAVLGPGHPGIGTGGVHTLIVQNGNDIYSNGTGGDGAGIDIEYAGSTNIIKDNTIHNNSRVGIGVHATASVTITHNEINNNTRGGILISDAVSTNTIQGNTIHDNIRGGIRIHAANSVTVEGNQIYSNGYGGIYDEGSDFLSVNGTDIHDNHYGGIQINYGTGDGNITHNTIHQNYRGGIGIRNLNKFKISNNKIYNNLRGGIHTGQNLVDGIGFLGTPGDANVTIKKNKVYGNGQTGYGGGIDVRHACGVIYNNLVYENHRAGIRFGDWIDEIVNNTVVSNGTNATRPGGGIVYDDLAGDVNAEPAGCAPSDIPIKNNISAYNVKTGIRVKICPGYACPANRDYNLLCRNNGIASDNCITPPYYCENMQLGMCPTNANEQFDDPLFADPGSGNYTLQSGSPAENAGDDGNDMGAYGGDDPITP